MGCRGRSGSVEAGLSVAVETGLSVAVYRQVSGSRSLSGAVIAKVQL